MNFGDVKISKSRMARLRRSIDQRIPADRMSDGQRRIPRCLSSGRARFTATVRGDQFCPALNEAPADTEIACGLAYRASPVIEKRNQFGIHLNGPIKRTRHREPSVKLYVLMLTKRHVRYKRTSVLTLSLGKLRQALRPGWWPTPHRHPTNPRSFRRHVHDTFLLTKVQSKLLLRWRRRLRFSLRVAMIHRAGPA